MTNEFSNSPWFTWSPLVVDNHNQVQQPLPDKQKQQPLPGPKSATTSIPYKYDEPALIKEISDYIDLTYQGHYVGEDNVQSLDLILATGHATGFNVGNILKYGSRYGKKDGYNRKDLLKVIHYAIFELYNLSHIDGENS